MKDLPYPYLKNIIDVHHLLLTKLLKLKFLHNLHTIVGGFFEFKKPLVLVLLNILELKNHQFDYLKNHKQSTISRKN
jgi:hypothetical protein